jgi:hypothetical protein
MKLNKNPYSDSRSVHADGKGPLLENTQHLQETDFHSPSGNHTRNPYKRAAADLGSHRHLPQEPNTNTELTQCGRVTQICVFNTVKLGTSASSP